jgi:hypothetical protein
MAATEAMPEVASADKIILRSMVDRTRLVED